MSPHVDGYKRTPASRVQDGSALLAFTPSETVISYYTAPPTHSDKPKLKVCGLRACGHLPWACAGSSTARVLTLPRPPRCLTPTMGHRTVHTHTHTRS